MEQPKIGFALSGIRTEQFAILENDYAEGKETGLRTGIQFKFNETDKMIGCFIEFVFTQEEKIFLKIEGSCHFVIEENSLPLLLEKEGVSYVFPKKVMLHFAMVTVGTTRGILFAKTENTKFGSFIIPFINVEEMITEDVEFAAENG